MEVSFKSAMKNRYNKINPQEADMMDRMGWCGQSSSSVGNTVTCVCPKSQIYG